MLESEPVSRIALTAKKGRSKFRFEVGRDPSDMFGRSDDVLFPQSDQASFGEGTTHLLLTLEGASCVLPRH